MAVTSAGTGGGGGGPASASLRLRQSRKQIADSRTAAQAHHHGDQATGPITPLIPRISPLSFGPGGISSIVTVSAGVFTVWVLPIGSRYGTSRPGSSCGPVVKFCSE